MRVPEEKLAVHNFLGWVLFGGSVVGQCVLVILEISSNSEVSNHLTDLRSQIELAAWFRRFSIDGADGTNSIHHSYAREIQISTDCTCTYCQQYVYVWNISPCTKQIEI